MKKEQPLKFAAKDAKYLTERKAISEKYGQRELWSVADHWQLYAGVSNIARALSIYEILKQQLMIPGDIAEFGSWRGSNLMFMAKVMQILDPLCSKQIHCFEGFEGLTEFSPQDVASEKIRGAYKGSLQELEELIRLYEFQDTIQIHKGLIEKQLPVFLDEYPGTSFSLLYFDADLYSSAKLVLNSCHPRLTKGGVIIFDEWNYPNWPGEGTAVREFMEVHGSEYQMENIPRTRQPSLLLRKL